MNEDQLDDEQDEVLETGVFPDVMTGMTEEESEEESDESTEEGENQDAVGETEAEKLARLQDENQLKMEEILNPSGTTEAHVSPANDEEHSMDDAVAEAEAKAVAQAEQDGVVSMDAPIPELPEEVVEENNAPESRPVQAVQDNPLQVKEIDLTKVDVQLGPSLANYRQKAGLTQEQLATRLGLTVPYLQELESDVFDERSEFFFLRRNVKRICREVNLDEERTGCLLQLLEQEYQRGKHVQTKGENDLGIPDYDPVSGRPKNWRRLIHKIPGILLTLILLGVLAMLFLAKVLPMLEKYRTKREIRRDFAPLIQMEAPKPVVAPIPMN